MKIMLSKIMLILLCGFLSVTSYADHHDYYGEQLCDDPSYTCHKVKRGQTWDKLFPDADQQDIVKRVNRRNMYLIPGMTIAIPKNLENITYFDVSPFPLSIEAPGEKLVKVDLDKLAWGAYDANGSLVSWGPASGGRGWCEDVGLPCRSATGVYRVLVKGNSHCVSNVFPLPNGGAAMPFCMHYYRAFALHGSFEAPGYNDSHGCIRMFINDARWLNEKFTTIGTKVIVSGGYE